MPPDALRVTALRPSDLLSLNFEFHGFTVTPGSATSPPMMVNSHDPLDPATIVVTFPPQHILEEAFYESDAGSLFFTLRCDGGEPYEVQARDNLTEMRNLCHTPYQNQSVDFGPELVRLLQEQCGVSIPDTPGKVPVRPQSGQWFVGGSQPQDGYRFSWDQNETDPALYQLTLPDNPVTLPDNPVTLLGNPVTLLGQPVGIAAQARIAGPSYLVFDASGVGSFDLTLESLLAQLTGLKLRLAPAAQPDPDAQPAANPEAYPIAAPNDDQTRIEAPYRLILSPTSSGGWSHASAALDGPSGRVELWHTRLGIAPKWSLPGRYAFADDAAFVRAIWALDPDVIPKLPDSAANDPVQHTLDPFRASLDGADRYNLVQLTSNYHLARRDPPGGLVTAPVAARRLMLSALGAWLDLAGDWPVTEIVDGVGQALSVSQWRHRATMGRDHFVRVVYEGFLYPFGHRAALIKITERKFVPVDGVNIAYLRQRLYILVREPMRSFVTDTPYGISGEHPFFLKQLPVDNMLPFQTVRIVTTVTPNLDRPDPALKGVGAQSLFWPAWNDAPFQFQLRALDRDGRELHFQAPLLFIALDAHTETNLANINFPYNYNASPLLHWESYRVLDLGGQGLAYAPSSQGAGATVFPTWKLRLGAVQRSDAGNLIGERQASFWPILASATVAMPDLQHLAGIGEKVTIGYEQLYLTGGMDSAENAAGQIFARPVDANDPATPVTLPLDFSKNADRSGAVITPNMAISTLSRSVGPAAGSSSDVAAGVFNPQDVFPGGKLLGQFDLKALIGSDAGFPRIVRTGTATRYEMGWEPVAITSPDEAGVLETTKAQLTLKVVTDVPDDGKAPTTSITGKLENFSLRFFGGTPFLRLNFRALCFTMMPGRKPDIMAALTDPSADPSAKPPVEFLEELGWVAELAQYIPGSGFSDPPAVEVTADGIAVGYSAALPAISMGIFSLQNLSLSGGLTLPFNQTPASVRFSFARRERPCILSFGPFGGGAFLALEFNTAGVQVLEMALEFGATLSVNLGVASGSIYAMGGLYFKLDKEACTLLGTFRMGGEVDVLGLVSASIELVLNLGYEAGDAVGRATIEVEVEVCFFSFSVRLGCERRFAGSAPDPTFRDVMAPYYVHKASGQVLYHHGATIFYLDRFDETRGVVYKDGVYGPPGSVSGLVATPIRDDAPKPPPESELVSPWLDYCQAFVKG